MKGKEELQPSEQVLARLLPETPKEIRSVSGGANNRVWEVKTLQGKYLLKQYFRSPEDSRDRFASEKAFYTHAQNKAPGKVPQVQAWDPEGGTLFLGGRPKTDATGSDGGPGSGGFGVFCRAKSACSSDPIGSSLRGGSGLDGM